jgi:hypothetical protein
VLIGQGGERRSPIDDRGHAFELRGRHSEPIACMLYPTIWAPGTFIATAGERQ